METQIPNYRERIWKEGIHFNNVGATLADNGDLDAEITHRIQSGWKNWKKVSVILCDQRISMRAKGKYTKRL